MSIDYSNFAFAKEKSKKKKKETVSEQTYNRVFNACKGKCVLCGSKDWLQLHHVLGRGKDLTDNYRYCVILCQNCHHNIVHQNNKKYRPILLDICDKLYKEDKK